MSATMHDSDADSAQNAVFERNMAAFRDFAPRLHGMLKAIERPVSRLEVTADGSVDIAVHGRKLYGRDAVAYTQEQLTRYFENPTRHFVGKPKPEMIPGLPARFCIALNDRAEQQGIRYGDDNGAEDCWFTVVFGIGLGLHLQTLAERTGCRKLILVEPIIENIYHSLSVIDWQEIFRPSNGTPRLVHFVTETAQEVIASNLRTIIREQGTTLLDGMYVYSHYPLTTLARAEALFNRDIFMHLAGLGFFEDELIMTANTVGNLARADARVIVRPLPTHDTPVLLCGSGPSIDGCFDKIRELQDRAIIVSLGSCLRSLLSHGIRPDYHVEMENELDNAKNICRTDDEFGVHGITLIASTTVRPAGAERFDDTILYFRDRLSSSHLFGQGIEWLGSCGPTVTNAALIALLYLGFRNFSFFGIDMGSRDVARYHASDTFIGMGQAREWGSGRRVPVIANFGGTAYAEGVLRWSRLAIETVVRLHEDAKFINCSDGAQIAGTLPMLPHRFNLDTPPLDRARLSAKLDEFLPMFGEQRRRTAWDRPAQERGIEAMIAQLGTLFDEVAVAPEAGIDWLKEVYDSTSYDSSSPAVPAFLFGSVAMMVCAVWWYDRRIRDAEQRDAFRRIAAEELRTSMAWAGDRLIRLFDDVDAVFAGQLAEVETDEIAPEILNFFIEDATAA